MDIVTVIVLVAAVAAVVGLLVVLHSRNRLQAGLFVAEERCRNAVSALENTRAEHERTLAGIKAEHEKNVESLRNDCQRNLESVKEADSRQLKAVEEMYVKQLETVREAHRQQIEAVREANQKQIEAVRAQIASESEKMLKARQEELEAQAKKTFDGIAGDFNRNLEDMKKAFDENKEKQSTTSAELRTQMEEAVKKLREQTLNVGEKAEHLANALRGQSKMQGCWGETQLNNLLQAEGLAEGRDYDREETLRDELGIVIHNDETGRRMRPDFILHYPDNTDVVVDCKVSLNALSDYFQAETEQEKEVAAVRNLKAIRDHVDELSRKDYSSYIKYPRKCIDYTVMYVPNVNAMVLARQSDAHLLNDAFSKNVLITTEETLMPFLRLIRSAWVNYEQARNQEKIVDAARMMVDRVRAFSEDYARMGQKLHDAVKSFDDGDVKLRENGRSIIHAAYEVERLGIKGKKSLPPMVGEPVPEDSDAESDE